MYSPRNLDAEKPTATHNAQLRQRSQLSNPEASQTQHPGLSEQSDKSMLPPVGWPRKCAPDPALPSMLRDRPESRQPLRISILLMSGEKQSARRETELRSGGTFQPCERSSPPPTSVCNIQGAVSNRLNYDILSLFAFPNPPDLML